MDKLKKLPYLKITLWIWIVFSVVYIGLNIWNSYLYNVYVKGYESAVIEIIKRPEIKECKPLVLHDDKTTVNLIDIACLKSSNSGTGETK